MFTYRAARSPGAKEGGESADKDYQLSARPRDIQPRGPEEAAVLYPDPGQAAGSSLPQPAGASENLLPEA